MTLKYVKECKINENLNIFQVVEKMRIKNIEICQGTTYFTHLTFFSFELTGSYVKEIWRNLFVFNLQFDGYKKMISTIQRSM